MQFSNIFKQLCSKKGITQKQALEEIGLARNANQKWKHGWPNGDTLKRIASYFNVTVDSLLQDDSTLPNIISNSAVIQGNTGNNVNVSNGTPISESMNEQEQELLRIFRGLTFRSKTKLMSLAFQVEDEDKI